MLASLPVCGTEACTVLASLDSDLYIAPDHYGQGVRFTAKNINRNGTERITSSSDADGRRCANGLCWRVLPNAGNSFVRLPLLIFSDDDKYARAAAGKDLIAPAKDLSKC